MSLFISKEEQAKAIQNVVTMAIQSLPPDEFDKIYPALKLLISNRNLGDLIDDECFICE